MTSPAFAHADATESASVEAARPQAHSAAPPDALFVVGNLGIGGSERKIVRLANRLRGEGLAVELACLNGPYTLEQGIRDVPLTKLERTGKFSLASVWKLRRLIAARRPATVFALNLYQALYVALATAFMPARPRTIALVNTSTFRGQPLWKRMYQAVLTRFDLVVHGSEAQRRFWVRSSARAARASTVVYNGVDSDHFEATGSFEAGRRLRAGFRAGPDSLVLGTVGMCRPEKNQGVLIGTLHSLRSARVDAHLVIAGDGPRRAELERQARDLAVADRVHFVGALDDVRPVLAALDVFVLPSIAVESFSNAALEAMSMGVPVVLSDIGGAREMIRDGVEGFVVSPAELPARLPALIATLYAEGRRRRQMGAAARARAVTSFSVPAMLAGYRGLLADRGRT